MFTNEGRAEYEKYAKWISDDDFDFSPDFVPTEDTPKEAVEYYKRIYSNMFPMVDVDAPDFFPTGMGLNC